MTVIAAMIVTTVTAGCETREIGGASEEGTRKLVFSDDFERSTLGSNWKVGKNAEDEKPGPGRWRIKDGAVYGRGVHNEPLWLKEKLPSKVRIEFDARAETGEGDLKVEVFGDGVHHESGYILIFGGWDNKWDVIARQDEHGDDRERRPSKKVEAGKTYRMAIERTGSTLRWYVDGELFMAYDDPNPLRGAGHRYFAFNDWQAPVVFDNVKIYRLN